MGKIKQLLLQEIQKIAAGEVIERPANVVKELVENALDAGATAISIYIEDAGKQLVRVVDNGCGMNLVDARMSIAHHATSKIKSVDDLETITTFGFRGEALSSICAVSQVTLITKEAAALEGIKLTVEDGVIKKEEVVACPPGTDIAIVSLFYNVPARRKFLKTRETEWRAILGLFQALCLSHQECHFKLYHENKLIINCSPALDLHKRLEQLFSLSLTEQLLHLDSHPSIRNFALTPSSPTGISRGEISLRMSGERAVENGALKIHGYITQPQYTRFDRSQQFFFVNKRWVKNSKLAHALMQGYSNVLQQGNYPAAFLFIEIDPKEVDINIHPRKDEVQFLHPRRVEQVLRALVSKRLDDYRSQQLVGKSVQPLQFQPSNSLTTQPVWKPQAFEFQHTAIHSQPTIEEFATLLEKPSSPQSTLPLVQETSYQLIGQLHTTYILLETTQGLVIVDQHAAHERILYEQFTTRFKEIAVSKLLFPHVITLSLKDSTTLEPYLSLFAQHGITIEKQSEQHYIVTSLPVHAKEQDLSQLIYKVIGWINEQATTDERMISTILHNHIHSHMACKAAVKAGDTLTSEQMHELVTNLYTTTNRLTCPHGRPTSWIITRTEIERTFKRKN